MKPPPLSTAPPKSQDVPIPPVPGAPPQPPLSHSVLQQQPQKPPQPSTQPTQQMSQDGVVLQQSYTAVGTAGIKGRVTSLINPKYLLIYLIVSGILIFSLLISAVVTDEFEGEMGPLATTYLGLRSFIATTESPYGKYEKDLERTLNGYNRPKRQSGFQAGFGELRSYGIPKPKFKDRESWSQAVFILLIFSAIFEMVTSILAVVMLIKPLLRKFLPLACIVIGVLNIIIFGLAMGLWDRHLAKYFPKMGMVDTVYGSSYKCIASSTFFNILNMIAAGLVFFLNRTAA